MVIKKRNKNKHLMRWKRITTHDGVGHYIYIHPDGTTFPNKNAAKTYGKETGIKYEYPEKMTVQMYETFKVKKEINLVRGKKTRPYQNQIEQLVHFLSTQFPFKWKFLKNYQYR